IMRNILSRTLALLFSVTAIACAVSCEPEENTETPSGLEALFTYFEKNWLDYPPWEMKKSGEGLTGEGCTFYYWWEHRFEAKSASELYAMCQIDNRLLSAMSTQNLVRCCYVYPYNGIVTAYCSPTLSFLDGIHYVMTIFNGYRELHNRKDAPREMLRLYKEVKYSDRGDTFVVILESKDYRKQGSIVGGIASFSLVMASAVDNECFTSAQIVELSKSVLDKIDEITLDQTGTYSFHTAFYPYLLGAVISFHYDSELSANQSSVLKTFIYDCDRSPVERSTIDLIYRSLSRIANK
ncbi:MAG TPA: hypothetical protein PK738_01460, partial [Bacteroidales bacterium]|nr:hypothetical protein [Bacteroidales bacterium]